MFHLCANFIALANVANTDVTPVPDGIIQIQNGHFVPSMDLEIVQSYASAVTLLRSRYNSPSIRQINPSYIAPVQTTLLPPTRAAILQLWNNPILARKQEELAVESTDSAAGPNNHYALTWLRRGRWPIPAGRPYVIRATSATAATASAWSLLAVTLETGLPVGNYAVIGGMHSSATAIGFRLTFDGQYPRPGGLSGVDMSIIPPMGQMDGSYGIWGIFNTVTLPRFEVLCNAADAAHIFHLVVVKLDDTGVPPLPQDAWGMGYAMAG